ncbi:MAG TPA: sugar phosphate nucleotidyltransferase, partial [Chitinophagales bacterium]|nr:sugar phosphate nucleotidyltransferase [Chitinophagales bacterium]
MITEFHEKPSSFISRMAIIGIYFFKDGDVLHNELQYLIDNNILDKGEYQLTSALTNLHQKGAQFGVAPVNEWLDCGHKDAVLYANQRVLELLNEAGNDEL